MLQEQWQRGDCSEQLCLLCLGPCIILITTAPSYGALALPHDLQMVLGVQGAALQPCWAAGCRKRGYGYRGHPAERSFQQQLCTTAGAVQGFLCKVLLCENL